MATTKLNSHKPINLNSGTDDAAHREALDETGFWGTRGSGCLILCHSTKRFLLGLRSKDVEEPLTWGGFGGAIDSKEDPKKAALREVQEETGLTIKPEIHALYEFRSGSFVYNNYLAIVQEEYKPRLDWETSRANWFLWDDFPKPYHFGLVAIMQDRYSMATIQKFLRSSP